ncbi:MAG: ABC transporter substrate-binding protein [Pseudomonadota bacterium]
MHNNKPHPYLPTLCAQLEIGRIGRRDFLRTATLLGLSAGAAYTLAGQAPRADAAELPQGGRLRLGMRLIDIASPHTYNWIWDSNIGRQVCEYLTKTGPDNITRPYLLESWTPSDDLRTWTLTLRPGITWHSGRPLTAEDVIWNLRRLLDAETGSSVLGLMKGYMLDEVTEGDGTTTRLWDANAIEQLDDLTLRLNCKAPQLAVPEHLFHYPCLMIDPEEGGAFAPGANGTGAFELVDYEIGKRAVLKARGDYWGDGPHVETLEFVDLGDDPTGEIEAMASQRLHGIDIADVIQLDAFKLMPHLQMYEVVTASTAVARGKVDQAPFDDPRVRKALKLAVDCAVIQQLTHGDHGLPAEHHHVSPVHPEYAELPIMYRDVAAAKMLLAESGHPEGLDLGTIDCAASPSWQFNAVQALVEQWKEAGLRAKINLLPANEFWASWDQRPFAFTGWVHRPLGIMVLGLGYRSGVPWNESGYANPEFDRLLLEAEGLLDIEQRREVMAKLERLMQEDGPIVQPLWRSEITFMDKRVKGFNMHPSTYIFGNELAIES